MDFFSHAWQVGALCFIVGFLFARILYRRRANDATRIRPEDISDAEIEAELRMGHKVEAIKLCRQKYGCDLKTAVDEINTRSAKLGLRP